MRHERTIEIPDALLYEIQKFLDGQGEGTCRVQYCFTAKFDKGVAVDIKVCDTETDSTPFIDAVIFENGQEIFCLDVRDTLLGEYVFDVALDSFVVIVQEE